MFCIWSCRTFSGSTSFLCLFRRTTDPLSSVIGPFVYRNSSYCCYSWQWWWLAISHTNLQLSSIWDVSSPHLRVWRDKSVICPIAFSLWFLHIHIWGIAGINTALQRSPAAVECHMYACSLLWNPAVQTCAHNVIKSVLTWGTFF